MLVCASAFAEVDWMNGEAEYAITYESVEVGDADAVNTLELGDGGRISFEPSASKELDNGATVAVETRLDIKYDEIGKDYIRLKYMNGPLTVQMLKADRPGIINKGLDKYVPQDAWYGADKVGERDISFAYAGDAMTFTTTINWQGSNKFGIRPHVKMGLGALSVEVAAEYLMDEFQTDLDADGPTKTIMGGGAALETTMGAIEAGVAGAYGITTAKDDAGDDLDDVNTMSASFFVKAGIGAGTVGVAGIYNMETSDAYAEDKSGMQVNAGFEQGNIVVPGLTVKIGAGYSTETDENDVDTNKVGGNFKLVYGF
jgi:hypothetical protein